MDEQAVLEYLYHAPSPFNFLVNYFHVPDNHPPLYYFLVIAIYKILPLGELGIRLVSVLAGLGLIIVLYYFSLLFFESRAQARLAMFFTAISSYFILISQMARYHSLAALWTLLSLYFFCKITIFGYTKRNLACFLVFALLLAYTDLPHFIYLITITNFFYFYKWLRNAKIIELKTWFGSQLGLLVLFLPVIYMFYLRVFNQNDKGFEKESLLGGSIIDRIADFLMHIYAYFFGENIFPWNYVPFLAGVLILGMLLVVLLKAAYDKRLTKNFYLLLYLVLSLLVLNTIFLNCMPA